MTTLSLLSHLSYAKMAKQQTNSQRSQYYTRTRLLNQLGYFQPPTSKATATATSSSSFTASTQSTKTPRGHNPAVELLGGTTFSIINNNSGGTSSPASSSGKVLKSGVPFETRLNDLPPLPSTTTTTNASYSPSLSSQSSMSSTTPATTDNKQTAPHHIHFQEVVKVLPIPSRYQYSERIKTCLWNNRYELQEMAQRNLQEFESEGYDWRNVVMDDEMYIDSATGNLIHPCHVDESYRRTKAVDDSGVNGVVEKEQEQQVDSDVDDDIDSDDSHFAPLQRRETITTQ